MAREKMDDNTRKTQERDEISSWNWLRDFFMNTESTMYLIFVHLNMSLGKVNPPSSCCWTWITNKRKQGIVGLSRDASLFINHELSVFNKTCNEEQHNWRFLTVVWIDLENLSPKRTAHFFTVTLQKVSVWRLKLTLTALSSSNASVVFVGTCLQT